jgi:hypothetical protein
MTAESLPTSALRVSVRMTPKEDTEGVRITLKVFWKTTRFWTDSDISDYHQNAPTIMMSLLKEKYWDGEGNIHGSKFTCEDFAVRVLCEFASQRGLPVCLVTGAATYRNMELYNPETHDRYSSNPWGFARMAMSTYGAPDMLKNATKIEGGFSKLHPGDILLRNDAGHVQVVYARSEKQLDIIQGNFPTTYIEGGLRRGLGKIASKFIPINPAQNPDADLYLGQLAQHGVYALEKDGRWSYRNTTLKQKKNFDTFHEQGIHLRWNFKNFSK